MGSSQVAPMFSRRLSIREGLSSEDISALGSRIEDFWLVDALLGEPEGESSLVGRKEKWGIFKKPESPRPSLGMKGEEGVFFWIVQLGNTVLRNNSWAGFLSIPVREVRTN